MQGRLHQRRPGGGSFLRPICAGVLMGISAALAADAGPTLYSDAELDRDQPRYAQRMTYLLEKGLLPFMTADETQALAGVLLDHPVRGSDLLSVDSRVTDGTPVITLPVEGLKLIEDLSVVYAWRYHNGYTLEPIDEYLAMLKYRAPAFGAHVPEPLQALGVPGRVWEADKAVDDLSLRFRNTAWAFILAHELGHVRLGHLARDVPAAEIQRQEAEADAFAVDLLGRSDTIPMGMIQWFQATAGYLKNRADFSSDAAYADWLRSTAEHPVNGARMRSLAAALDRQAARASDPDRAEVLRFIADRLSQIGATVENPDMQRFLRRCADLRSPKDLARHDTLPCA